MIYLQMEICNCRVVFETEKFKSFQEMLATQNVLILNIAVADLLLIIFNMPLTMMDVSNIYWEADLTFGLVNVL